MKLKYLFIFPLLLTLPSLTWGQSNIADQNEIKVYFSQMTNIEAANLALYNKVGTCKARRVGAAGARYLLHLTVGSGNSAQNYRYGWLSGPYSWTANWNSKWTPSEVTTNLETLGIQVKQSVASGLCGTLSFDYFSNDVTSLVNNSDVEFFMQNNTLKCRANGFAKQIRNPNNCSYQDVKTLLPPKVCKYLYQIKASKFNRPQVGSAFASNPALSQLTQQVEAEIQKAEVLEASSIPIPQLTDVAEVLPMEFFIPQETLNILEGPLSAINTVQSGISAFLDLNIVERRRIKELYTWWHSHPPINFVSNGKVANQLLWMSQAINGTSFPPNYSPSLEPSANFPTQPQLRELTRSNLHSLAPAAQSWNDHPYTQPASSLNCALQATQLSFFGNQQ